MIDKQDYKNASSGGTITRAGINNTYIKSINKRNFKSKFVQPTKRRNI